MKKQMLVASLMAASDSCQCHLTEFESSIFTETNKPLGRKPSGVAAAKRAKKKRRGKK